MIIRVKRVYERPATEDGRRILVDRLWPRGLSKGAAAVDLWLKEIAPSNELRRWFQHDPEKWTEFRKHYRKELAGHEEELTEIRAAMRKGAVTLLYGARDQAYNNAVALRDLLEEGKGRG